MPGIGVVQTLGGVGGPTSDAVYVISNGTSTPTLPGVGSSGNPFQLQAVEQIVNVEATTQDVYVEMPDESSMLGLKVTVNFTPDSTHAVYLVPRTGDTVAGSNSNYQLMQAGVAYVFEGGSGRDYVVVSTGPITNVTYPAAPNVSSATASVGYVNLSSILYFDFAGTITLPNVDLTHLKKVHVIAIGPSPSTVGDEIFTIYGPFPPGGTVDWDSEVQAQYLNATQTFTIKFVCENETSVTASPFTLTGVQVVPILVTNVVATDNPSQRVPGPQNTLTPVFSVQVTTDSIRGTQPVSVWAYAPSYPNPWNYCGVFQLAGTGLTSTITVNPTAMVPDVDQIWDVAVIPGVVPNLPTPPGGAVKTAGGFSVSAYGNAAATDVTAFSIGTLLYKQDAAGNWQFGVPWSFTNPAAGADKNWWTTRQAVEKGHNISGTWTTDTSQQPDGVPVGTGDIRECADPSFTMSDVFWDYIPSPGDPFPSFRFHVDCRSRNATTDWVLQTGSGVPSGGYVIVTPVQQGTGAPLATDITGATIPGSQSTWAQGPDADVGHQYLKVPAPTYSEAAVGVDPNAVWLVFTVQTVDGSGNPLNGAVETPYAGTGYADASGLGPLELDYVDSAFLRYRAYVMNASVGGHPERFADTTVSTLQSGAWTTGDHYDIPLGPVPAGALNLARVTSTSLGPFLIKDPTTGKPTLGSVGNVTIVGLPQLTYLANGQLQAIITYTAPSDPLFSGVVVEVEEPDQSAVPVLVADGTQTWNGTALATGHAPQTFGPLAAGPTATVTIDPPPATESIRFRLRSCSSVYTNPASSSPSVAVTVSPDTVAKPLAGTAYCANATWSINPASAGQPYNLSGKLDQDITFSTIAAPNDPLFSGWEIWSLWPNDPNYYQECSMQAPDATGITITVAAPTTLTGATFILRSVSIDNQGNVRRNPIIPTLTPSVVVALGSVVGTIDLTAALTASLNGADFHIDPTTGKFAINNVDMSKAINLSTQFAFDPSAGVQKIVNLDAGLLVTGAAQVGGPGMVSQFKYFDTHGGLLGFDGDDSANTGYVGSWRKRLGIGGPDPLHPLIFSDSNGNITISGTLITGTVPAASIAGSASSAGSVPATGVGAGPLGSGVTYSGTIYADQIFVRNNIKISGSLLANNIDASQISGGTITASITLTAPTLEITTSSFILNVDASNALQITGQGAYSGLTTTVRQNEISIQSSAGNSVTMASNGALSCISSLGGSVLLQPQSLAVTIQDGLIVAGNQVVGARYTGAKVTLADVWSLIAHHGL